MHLQISKVNFSPNKIIKQIHRCLPITNNLPQIRHIHPDQYQILYFWNSQATETFRNYFPWRSYLIRSDPTARDGFSPELLTSRDEKYILT